MFKTTTRILILSPRTQKLLNTCYTTETCRLCHTCLCLWDAMCDI